MPSSTRSPPTQERDRSPVLCELGGSAAGARVDAPVGSTDGRCSEVWPAYGRAEWVERPASIPLTERRQIRGPDMADKNVVDIITQDHRAVAADLDKLASGTLSDAV